jgi:hypothetical protein
MALAERLCCLCLEAPGVGRVAVRGFSSSGAPQPSHYRRLRLNSAIPACPADITTASTRHADPMAASLVQALDDYRA